MGAKAILDQLKTLSNPEALAAMAKVGINPESAYGISIPDLRRIAKEHDKSHIIADKLWASGVHEARILASMIDDPQKVTRDQMDRWAKDFDSWDLCDQCCNNLFRKTRYAHAKAIEWAEMDDVFVKRAGFALMAALAVHDKEASDDEFLKFLPDIARESIDSRNFVKKAVNWALRQIGKRNLNLNREASKWARMIKKMPYKSSKWIASDALRELTSKQVLERLKNTNPHKAEKEFKPKTRVKAQKRVKTKKK
jgi:3-methyladenine DNA glycosylase AlkD